MKIDDLRVDHFRIPLPEVLSDSTHGEISHFALVAVRLRTDGGEEGLGYTYTVGDIGGTATRAVIDSDLRPVLVDADPRAIESIWQRMWWRVHFVGRGGIASFAMSAVDIALWDLRAKRAGEPLWRLLGGADPRVKAYAGGIDLGFGLDRLQSQTRDFLRRGFRAVKMKVGRERLAEDIERVAAMRSWLGGDLALMVDANMRWTVGEAIRAARALRELDVYWLEEPTLPEDVEGHARIAIEGGVPIATGENLHTLEEFRRMIAGGAIAFPEPDVANIGGITPWLKVAHLAEAHNLPVTSHGVHDLHVHLLAAVDNGSFLEVHGFGLERFVRDPLVIDNGVAVAPERPGHGVALDWEALEQHRSRG